jgi:transcriptional regulator with XRE-family HTH domain
MTQADAARALGRSQSFVAKVESGERRVDVAELIWFARLYRKPVAFFLVDEVTSRQKCRVPRA